MKNLNAANVATALVLIYALVGGILVVASAITHPDPEVRLTFPSYLSSMAIAAGGLAIGRGLSSTNPGT